ncbi:MAG TPA: DMT family transporter [Marmoricola sp.]|jgi:drug/metabolite transporter (DMT)-like permease|nr:DMT family transporter [Marmoricola sp.]
MRSTAPGSRRSGAATLVLVAMTACWGSTFFLIHGLVTRVPAADFLAVRFSIASVVMLLAAPRAIARLSPAVRRHAVVLGCLYGVAQIGQTVGLEHTTASVAGFITGLYVVLTPLFAAAILRTPTSALTWIAVGLATVGLGVLSLNGLSIGAGEGLTLLAAMLYALHIVGLGAWSSPTDALGMSLVQCLVITAIALVAAAPGGITLPQRPGDWAVVLYTAVFASAVALLGQTWAQAHLPATRSAIIMSMEPVFAAGFAVGLGGESLSARMVLGGVLVLCAMLLAELVPRRRIEGEVPHIAV